MKNRLGWFSEDSKFVEGFQALTDLWFNLEGCTNSLIYLLYPEEKQRILAAAQEYADQLTKD